MKKIVHIIWSFGYGGIQTMVADLVSRQADSHQVHLVIINRDIASSMLERVDDRVRIHRIGRKKGTFPVFRILRMNWIIHRIGPHVIHCHFHNQARILFLFRKKKLHLTVHDMNRPFKNNIYRYRKVFAISGAVRADILRRAHIESGVVYNGIDMDSIRVKENGHGDLFRIVQVSRLLHTKKGQDILLRALAQLVHEHKVDGLELSLIGTGESESYLKNLSEELEIADRVKFPGYRDREYITGHLRDFDLLVQPSRYEGFGITVIEAMAAGVPVLVSDIDGPMEIIGKGRYGSFFERGNAEDCARKILEIMEHSSNGALARKTALNRQYALDTFSIVRTAGTYIKNYQ